MAEAGHHAGRVYTSQEGVIFMNGAKLNLSELTGANSSSGLLMGTGTSGSPAATSTADGKFVELRCKTTASSGDNRLLYLRYQMNGGGGGECVRAFTKLDSAVGSARGAHFSLDIDDSPAGSVTGLGVGLGGQLVVPDAALPAGGSYYGGQSEIYSAGSSSTIAAVSEHAIHSFTASGDGTGADTVLNCFAFKGNTDGSGKMIYSHGHSQGNAAGSIRVLINGTVKYMKFWDAE